MGGVAVISTRYLIERLAAKEFGSIEPYEFYDADAVSIKDNVVMQPDLPESKFFFWKKRGVDNLVLFKSDGQPTMNGYKLANLILDAAEELKIQRILTFAAAPNHVYHVNKPRVLGAATSQELATELQESGISLINSGNISGMNGLLIGVAKERNIDGACLLGEIPVYATQLPNPKSAKAVLEIATKILNLEVDLSGFDEWIYKVDKEMDGIIDRFTETHDEESKWLLDYFENLKKTSEDTEIDQYRNEELLREIEQFLEKERGQEEDQ
jgi:proteasome assembly chaperone (PAC2) family protein